MDTVKSFFSSFRIGDLLKNTDILGRKGVDAKKNSWNRRKEERYMIYEDCRVAGDMFSSPNVSKAIDISRNGIRIRFSGIPLRPDSAIKIDIKNIDVSAVARTVWSKRITDMESEAGLELNAPLPEKIIEKVKNLRA